MASTVTATQTSLFPRSTTPVSRTFGLDRGTAVDRYYIEGFLHRHAHDIRGAVLEVGDARYTEQFGEGVRASDVLDISASRRATLVGDLAGGAGLPRDAYDAIILTQVLPFVREPAAALRNVWSMLRPGGVLLATVPGISQISRYEADRCGDYHRFTPQGLALLLDSAFGCSRYELTSFGNVLSAAALLFGHAAQELRAEELDAHDPDYPVILAARAVR